MTPALATRFVQGYFAATSTCIAWSLQMYCRAIRLFALPLFLLLPARLSAQLPIMIGGFAGVAFPTDENTPGEASGGFSFQAEAGVRFRHASFGAEFGQHKIGDNAKTRVYGGFGRLPSFIGEGPVQIYLVIGLGAYQFVPTGGKTSTTAGGSLGPGVSFPFRGTPLAVDIEVRFHSTFDQLPRINNQQFISAIGGIELRF